MEPTSPNVIGAKGLELVCTSALASRRRHLLRREKRRYLMTQIAGRLIEGADLNLKDEKYKSHPWDGRSTAGATLQPGTTASSARWSCSWFPVERELSPSGWSPRACARIRRCSLRYGRGRFRPTLESCRERACRGGITSRA